MYVFLESVEEEDAIQSLVSHRFWVRIVSAFRCNLLPATLLLYLNNNAKDSYDSRQNGL